MPAKPAPDALGGADTEKMLRAVAGSLGIWRTSLWYEDALQAARIRIWQSGAAPGAWPTVAYRAMVGELRRELGRGDRPDIVLLDDAPELACDRPSPEACAHAAQVLRHLERSRPGWVQAILLGPSLVAAARMAGRCEAGASIICRALTRDALRLAERKPQRQRAGDWRALQAVADSRRLQHLPGLTPKCRRALQALAEHGCIISAAAAIGCSTGKVRNHLRHARLLALAQAPA